MTSSDGLTLLMVEDQRFDAMLLRKQLATPAINVEQIDHAETLAGAIGLLGQRDYDAVLLDLGLSDSDGIAAVEVLREQFPKVAIVVLTGRDEQRLGRDAMAAGAQDMLIKGSFDADLLARAVHYAIERQRLKGNLRQSAEENRVLFENNPFPIWVYDVETLQFLAVNEAASREYGYSREEFLEMNLLDVRPAEDREKALAAIRAARNTSLHTQEWRHRRKDGSVFDVEINAQALEFRGKAARIVLGRDITMRKRAVRALEISEGRFRKLFQYSLGLICTHDLDGIILSVNPACARALDYTPGDLMGRRLSDMMPPELRTEYDDYLKRVVANGMDSGLLQLIARDGSARIWHYHNILDNDADEPYVLGHAQDITERRMYEHKLREQSTHDPLTGCYNRRFLEEEVARFGDRRWGCILIDLDHFKQINDTMGHERGDEVLVGIARFLTQNARACDVVVRMGGDEFLLLIDNADETIVRATAERLREDGRHHAPAEFTVGWAMRQDAEKVDATIGRADKDLYAVRAAARGTISSVPGGR